MKKFFYRVRESDTIFSVSQKFSVAVTKLISQNNLNREICEGDIIYVEQNGKALYKVQPTDTLSSLSQRFKVEEQQILDQNSIPYIFYGLLIHI